MRISEERVIRYIYNSMGLSLLYYIVAISMLFILQWKWKKLPISILVPYLFLILSTTVFARQSRETVTFDATPLKFLLTDDEWTRYDFLRQMWANAIMFIPIGFLMPQAFSRKKKVGIFIKLFSVCLTIVASLLLSIGIEYLQLRLKRGYSEADDIISNMIGVLTGIVIYVIVSKFREQNKSHKNTIHE